jgi:hypothetical protein
MRRILLAMSLVILIACGGGGGDTAQNFNVTVTGK